MANTDTLSRLPLQMSQTEVPQPPELVHLVEYLDSTPLRSESGQITISFSPGSGDGYRRDGQLKTREIKSSFNRTTDGEMS